MIFFSRANRLLFVFLFFVPTVSLAQITTDSLVAKYNNAGVGGERIRILVVPGHEPTYGGTEFIGLKERDMTVYTAEGLVSFLRRDSRIEPILARDYHSWNKDLGEYFVLSRNNIKAFRQEHTASMQKAVFAGSMQISSGAKHNPAPEEVSIHLFGINKWANENGIDLVVHIHFNDFPDHGPKQEGKYKGLVVYVPDRQYRNATTSWAIGRRVFAQLNRFHATSTLLHEDAGVAGDQELIAIGAHNTLNAPSLLIEYGYIYEPQFWYGSIRKSVMTDSAYETYLGLEDFFNSTSTTKGRITSVLFPDHWSKLPSLGKTDMSTYLLQKALASVGVYPPKGETLYTCPLTGKMAGCTTRAIVQFQEGRGIRENGFGPKTRLSLEEELEK